MRLPKNLRNCLAHTIVWLLALGGMHPASAERLRELASVQGVRSNQLLGYGIVVGLDGSGDQTAQSQFTVQSVLSMLSQLGVQLPPGVTPQLRNAAAVMVTAQLPAFAQPGQNIDVTVSSLGNAKSLRGGTLLLTPLRGADGQVYGMAQGNVIVGGAGAAAGGSKVQINHLSAGRVPSGASVERVVPNPTLQSDFIQLELKETDFTTARLIAQAINTRMRLQSGPATALDARVVRVPLPLDEAQRVNFISELESLEVTLASPSAKVIINARTGTVVMNQAVTIGACAIAHGNLTISVQSTPVISQPGALSSGQTVVAEKTDIAIRQDGASLIHLAGAAKLADVVKALNSLGANAQDLIGILQAMKSAGALRAELEIL
jgi:flagellar P-ring protein FlgI